MDVKCKEILVLGLGMSGGGVGVAKFLSKEGAFVTIADKKTKKELAKSIGQLKGCKNIRFFLGKKNIEHSVSNIFDMVIVNPAVNLRSSVVHKIKKLRIPIQSELGIFLKHNKGKVIAITGTKGKGTTATLAYNILKKAGKDVLLGGNIGVSLLDKLPHIKNSTIVVLEVSSFQLDLLKLSGMRSHFFISALTNIYPDHLDRYDSFGAYKKSKLSIFSYPSRFQIKKIPALPSWIDVKKIKILGAHNRKNIALAAAVAKKAGISKNNIVKAVYAFRGLPHRLEFAGKKKGISFYNDSYSTTPDSTIFALRSFSEGGAARKIILIAGGVSKGSSFKPLAREVKKRAKAVIVFGKSAEEIRRAFKNVQGRVLRIMSAKTLLGAVHEAKKNAVKNDIILFSPACASFDQFRNARERGETFKKLVRKFK